jgi:molybdopterin-guanine dinucleotide biosynthesis protein A
MMRTLLIPAAGKGARLGSSLPKALTLLNGRPLIDFVLDASQGLFDKVVVVINPNEEQLFYSWTQTLNAPISVEFAFQDVPRGSMDAVLNGLRKINPIQEDAVVVIWADQVGVARSTIAHTLELLTSFQANLVVPLIEIEEPYIWYELGESNKIQAVYRRRDGDIVPRSSLSDVGLFGLSGHVCNLLSIATPHDIFGEEPGQRESDFTYALPYLCKFPLLVETPQASGLIETLAINTPDDYQSALGRLH